MAHMASKDSELELVLQQVDLHFEQVLLRLDMADIPLAIIYAH